MAGADGVAAAPPGAGSPACRAAQRGALPRMCLLAACHAAREAGRAAMSPTSPPLLRACPATYPPAGGGGSSGDSGGQPGGAPGAAQAAAGGAGWPSGGSDVGQGAQAAVACAIAQQCAALVRTHCYTVAVQLVAVAGHGGLTPAAFHHNPPWAAGQEGLPAGDGRWVVAGPTMPAVAGHWRVQHAIGAAACLRQRPPACGACAPSPLLPARLARRCRRRVLA